MSEQTAAADVVTMRPFVPASDFEKSLRFFVELGFTASRIDSGLASMHLGPFSFLLQAYDVENFAENYMMQLMVNDLDAWWTRIEALDLAARYGVRAPTAPKLQPWGLTVTYVVNPAGVLWHFVQKPD